MADIVEVKLELEKTSLEEIGSVEYAGEVRLFGSVPPPLLFARTSVKDSLDKIVFESKDIVWPIKPTMKKEHWYDVTPQFGLPMGVFSGVIDIKKGGTYKVYTEVFAEPTNFTPALGVSEEIELEVSSKVITPGTAVLFAIPVTNTSKFPVEALVRLRINEGSFWSSPGKLIEEIVKTVLFKAAEKVSVEMLWDTVPTKGGDGRVDLGVTVLVGEKELKSESFDDVFYIKR